MGHHPYRSPAADAAPRAKNAEHCYDEAVTGGVLLLVGALGVGIGVVEPSRHFELCVGGSMALLGVQTLVTAMALRRRP